MKKKVISQINIVPYVDVMLVLFVILMVTMPLMQRTVTIELPSAGPPQHQTSEQDKKKNLYMTLDAQGICRIDGVQMNEEEMIGMIQKNMKDHTISVRLEADRRVPYQKVYEIMVMLQRQGVHSIDMAGLCAS